MRSGRISMFHGFVEGNSVIACTSSSDECIEHFMDVYTYGIMMSSCSSLIQNS